MPIASSYLPFSIRSSIGLLSTSATAPPEFAGVALDGEGVGNDWFGGSCIVGVGAGRCAAGGGVMSARAVCASYERRAVLAKSLSGRGGGGGAGSTVTAARASPDSLGIYFTYDPLPGRSNAERNCISNVRPPEGLSYALAAHRLFHLMVEARRRKLSGVALKEAAPALPGAGE